MSDHTQTNRLIHETSPYLLQHAHNPVDWYPWGPEAIAAASDQDKPIFLSIGYSACHWCHVMERESFENPRIAELMNRYFINIKVDREERPDLDQIYMSAVQLVTGQGGWPMSVFLTPQGEPFYGGTYWPPVSRHGMPGFADILSKIHQYWTQHRDECISKGQQLVQAIDEMHHYEQARSPLQEDLLRHAQHRLIQSADPQEGGFGNAPKFPHPVDLRVLLRCWDRFGQKEALQAATLTLDKMAAGGIYDHLGGGFARYSTDRYWLVPHFEKMLYDNAQLVVVYLEAWQATGNPEYERVVQETLAYVLREMTSPEGGFYSTQDADSEGVEGKFYVWSAEEIEAILGPETAALFNRYYRVMPEGNWEGHNILHTRQTLEQFAAEVGQEPAPLQQLLQQAREKLLNVRNQRVWPGRDDKMIVAWNGLMLSGFARAAHVLQNQQYLDQARKSAAFLLHTLRKEDGSLWHSRKDGRNSNNGFLDDYACLIEALCELYIADPQTETLREATSLTEVMLQKFYDAEAQAFHYTPDDHEDLIVRVRDRYDSAIPSGSNLAIHALLRVGHLSGREDFREIAAGCLEVVSGVIRQQPSGMGQASVALDFYLGPVQEQILCLPEELSQTAQEIKHRLLQRLQPRSVLLFPGKSLSQGDSSPLLAGKTVQQDQPTLYECEQGVCHSPLVGTEAILNPEK